MADAVLQYGHPVLRGKAEPVGRITPAVRRVVQRLGAALRESGGLGLAAPQIGELLRIFVYHDEASGALVTVIDPQLVKAEGEVIDAEGCLSLRRLYGDVRRAERVIVKAKAPSGKRVTLAGEDLHARILQHEMDHLDGVLFVDRVDPATLHWVVGEPGESGEINRVYTTLEDALKVFELRMAGRL
jgi:peptide deformylase